MIVNSKKIILKLMLASTFACLTTTAHAIDLVKETTWSIARHFTDKESLKIIAAGTAAYVGFHAMHNILLAHVSPEYFYNSKIVKPITSALKETPIGFFYFGLSVAVMARSPLLNKSLTLSDLKKPAAIMLASASLASLIKGIITYKTFDKEKKEEDRNHMTAHLAREAFYRNLSSMRALFLSASILLLRTKP